MLWDRNSSVPLAPVPQDTAKSASGALAQPAPEARARSGEVPSRVMNLASLITTAVNSNVDSISGVISTAMSTTNRAEIDAAARDASRNTVFDAYGLTRNRKLARDLHDPVRASLNQPGDVRSTCDAMRRALEADPLDAEIAGNLAICMIRLGRGADAQQLAIYALSLPRAAGKTGRTADWVTLGASYALLGDEPRAAAALYVTLGIAPDIGVRCASAVFAVRNTFGTVLKKATEAMFERIREINASDAPACALPIAW